MNFTFDWRDLNEIFGLLVIVGGAIMFVFWLFLRPKVEAGFASKDASTALAKKVDGLEVGTTERFEKLERRVGVVERDVAALPTKRELHNLELKIEALRGDSRAVSTKVEAMNASLTRIENHLLPPPRS